MIAVSALSAVVTNYDKEVKNIKQIAVNNGYRAKLIDQMIDQKLFK